MRRRGRIVCFNGQRRTLTAKEKCQTIFSKNITIDDLGLVTFVLGDYFSFPDNFMKLFNDGDSGLKSIFKISLLPNSFHKLNLTIETVSFTESKIAEIKRGKKIGERSVEELVNYKY